ncbi:MAG: pyridoxamine 5'-phosphate oxidase family protein [Planctomycetota bacterium]
MSLRSAFESVLDRPDALSKIDSLIWQSLAAGSASARHPWNLGNLITIRRNQPQARTVVIRKVDKQCRTLDLFTDRRSGKIDELAENANIAWHFYTSQSKVQLRLQGQATVVTDEATVDAIWDTIPLISRADYLSISAPGTAVNDDQPRPTSVRPRDASVSEKGRENFCIVRTKITQAEWLMLRREGHLRMTSLYSESQPPVLRWLVP